MYIFHHPDNKEILHSYVQGCIHPCGLISPSVRFLRQPTQLGPRFHNTTLVHYHASTIPHWYNAALLPHTYKGSSTQSHTAILPNWYRAILKFNYRLTFKRGNASCVWYRRLCALCRAVHTQHRALCVVVCLYTVCCVLCLAVCYVW